MRIDEALAQSARLEKLSDSARLDLELLLCHLLEKPRSYLFTWPDRTLTPQQQEAFMALLARREKGEPVAHILGYRDFWTLQLEVTPDTLIPRPDTETLVELALAKLDNGDYRVADLGTGTGAIALALASERPAWQLTGCDRVAAAVALAERNRQRLGISNAGFCQSNWFDALEGEFDLLVSNPPYIDPQDPHLAQGDVRFEPLSALVADNAGMADIQLIAEQARHYLKPGGWLMFEHGYDQGEASRRVLAQCGYSEISTEQDLGSRDRVTLGRWPAAPGTGVENDVE
ncbi:peptide chain release factor N(5)-glutamine methyltransferase [Marinobacterium jannaschii]|uniref:peptide chain release factor N(5)-glutamine methyltransferase n=1 Tax=Marinobacterium jannaschii TaxID=64970 RepID=UPI0006847D10|nr:peptide chain release factor N(5)-glutamine methyltransferase [Marinobacterium jannaschii]